MRNNMKEPLWLMREIYRSYKGEMADVAAYTYGQILFEKTFPPLSDLFASIALSEMRHYHALGELLRDLGASHALKASLQDFSYRCEGNCEDHLPVARHFLGERIKEERRGAARYAQLAGAATGRDTAQKLQALARDEEEHAASMAAALQRLTSS